MPIHADQDQFGYYVQWGFHGHKYYYDPNKPSTYKKAYERASLQQSAAYANGYREFHKGGMCWCFK